MFVNKHFIYILGAYISKVNSVIIKNFAILFLCEGGIEKVRDTEVCGVKPK